ncbi:hypothetical protein STEG23_023444, partial [Scotinomys teguina]
DKKLWIASRLIWFDQPRPPDRFSDVSTFRSASRQLAQKMKPHRLLQSGRWDNGRKRKWPRAIRKRRDASPPGREDTELL